MNGHDPFGILQAERSFGADGLLFQGSMEAFEFAVALRVMRRGEDVRGLPEADELLKIARDELAAVIMMIWGLALGKLSRPR